MHNATETRRKAFDIGAYQRYKNSPEQAKRVIAEDLYSLFQEGNANQPLHKRITYTNFELGGDRLIDPRRGNLDVSVFYRGDTLEESAEYRSATLIREVLFQGRLDTLYVWISPHGGPFQYREGKLSVGWVQRHNGKIVREQYDLPATFPAEKYLQIASHLSEFSPGQNYNLSSPEQLRDQVFVLPEIDNPTSFLSEAIPELNLSWKEIESGNVRAVRDQMIARDTNEVADQIVEETLNSKSEVEQIRVGARAERLMMSRGYFYTAGSCGLPNFLLETVDGQVYLHVTMASSADVIYINGEKHKYVRRCGKCPTWIGKYMKAHDRCPNCRREYLCV